MNNASTNATFEPLTLATGETVETAGFRVSCGARTLVITDLSNAGKRGRKVREFVIDCKDPSYTSTHYLACLRTRGYDALRNWALDCQADGLCKVYDREPRGVDVAPAGMALERVQIGRWAIMLDWSDFTFRNTADPNETTVTGQGRARAAKVRAWVKSSPDFVAGIKSASQLWRALRANGIEADTYCAMD